MTGMSGAGRTTCLKMLEDLGYEAVDNLPVNLLGRLAARDDGEAPDRLAIGMDSRTRGFAPERVLGGARAARARIGPAFCSWSATTRCCGAGSPRPAAATRWRTSRAWPTRWPPSAS